MGLAFNNISRGVGGCFLDSLVLHSGTISILDFGMMFGVGTRDQALKVAYPELFVLTRLKDASVGNHLQLSTRLSMA